MSVKRDLHWERFEAGSVGTGDVKYTHLGRRW